jgi:thymidylate synthase ThyX
MSYHGLHKQAANRITEPFMQMKVVCSGTEWSNFFWLRNHKDAQPEIRELARQMWREYSNNSLPLIIKAGEWHLPYISREIVDDCVVYTDSTGNPITQEDAKIISASCCAQVSYRKNDDSLEKARAIYSRLIESEPVHASPVEHQATPVESLRSDSWPEGITHKTRNGDIWSGNFRGWIQHRQLIPNHSKMEI